MQRKSIFKNTLVIILNEFGTGIKGTQDEYASKHGYTVNLSGKGEEGWAFPTKNGEYKWTHGIPSRRMFYDAYEDIKAEIGNIVDIEIRGNIGNLYSMNNNPNQNQMNNLLNMNNMSMNDFNLNNFGNNNLFNVLLIS